MRIGFFSDTYIPVVHGVTISMETFRKELEKMGHTVYIYTTEIPGYKDLNPNVFRFKSVRVFKKPELRNALDFMPIGHSFNEVTKFPLDIIHAHTPFSLGVLAKYVAKKQKIPIIYTHHTHYPEYVKAYLKETHLLPYLAKVYSRWFCNLSNAVIAPSLKIKKLLYEYGVNKNIPIHVLPTGIDLNIFKPSSAIRSSLRKKLKISAKTKVLIHVGRIGEEKNVEFVVRAFAEIKKKQEDTVLMMVGDGYFLDKLKEIVKGLGIGDSVIFTGPVPYESIVSYYQASDMFVFASLADTQGIVILEAMACGLPVVAIKDDAFSDMMKDGEDGFMIKQQSVVLFAEKVLKIFSDKVLYDKFSDSAQKRVLDFSKEKTAQKLEEIYKSLVRK